MPPYPKAKNDVPKLTIKKDKPPVGMIEKDGPIADSPVAIDFEGWRPEGSAQDIEQNLPGMKSLEHKTPCETPDCKHCGRESGVHPTEVLPNSDNPFSGL